LGEYYNAVALSFFLVFMAIVSTLEVVLLLVADRDGLLETPLSTAQRRYEVMGSLAPVGAAVIAIPLVFVSVPLGAVAFVGFSLALGALVNRRTPASVPTPS
jgi:hypothetical protein